MIPIKATKLSVAAFAPFGDVLECSGDPDQVINQGYCGRYHDRATLEFSEGRAGISLFQAKPRPLPYILDLMERHPLGSQAFIPMDQSPFLVIVATDNNNIPGTPRAFLTQPGQGVNIYQNTWHGVLTPLAYPGLFAVVDRIGDGSNLQEHVFDEHYVIDV